MDEKDKELLKKIRPERHVAAMITLANIKYIKDECKGKECCECRFYNKEANFYEKPPCILTGYDELNPEDWDEYEITERMYK